MQRRRWQLGHPYRFSPRRWLLLQVGRPMGRERLGENWRKNGEELGGFVGNGGEIELFWQRRVGMSFLFSFYFDSFFSLNFLCLITEESIYLYFCLFFCSDLWTDIQAGLEMWWPTSLLVKELRSNNCVINSKVIFSSIYINNHEEALLSILNFKDHIQSYCKSLHLLC